MTRDKNHVRILVCGDEGVGKTSLISTHISQHFPERGVPALMPEVKLAPEESDDGVQTTIWDSSRERDPDRLKSLMQRADAVVLLCDEREITFEHLDAVWLPMIQQERQQRQDKAQVCVIIQAHFCITPLFHAE
jgi:mitochondrial Rho GTPase 1